MKKAIIILFIIGFIFGLLDVNNMMLFLATKVLGIIMMMPMFMIMKGE